MGRCHSTVAFWLLLVISRVLSPLLCLLLHSTPRLLFCTPVQMSPSPPYIVIQRRNTPKHHHFSQFYRYGDHELKFPGDMSAIRIYGRLEYMRMTLYSIFSIKPFMIAYQAADPKCLLWSLTDPYIGLLLLK